ncbi:MAG: SDR family NAD(P)-dependent oxidoreductase, partial [Actinomycetota bacterium]|nr:SDR family NAD(P)-dependent oxidoreductase [Actinomycetota bacterium]
ALALNIAPRGAHLALSDIDRDAVVETAAECEALGAEARAYHLDVSSRTAVVAHADEVVADFGGVNVLVNNAGVALVGELTEVSWEQLDWITGINVDGVLNGSKAFLPHLISSGDGHLVNMSSLWGLIGAPLESHYCASKFFVRGLTESLRQEMRRYGHPVGVTVVHPGFVKTDLLRSGRSADDEAHKRSVEHVDRRVKITAEDVADKVIKGILKDRARVLIGPDAYAGDLIARSLGPWYQHLTLLAAKRLA